eukprot:m.148043 g.148043  ORF g.148043 m.148043 type:complete len:167 (+) comp17304_c0_seq1:217-717(+)
MVAYHGSALENFYSIVRLGFCAHLNKTSLYGKGTYLSTDLRVCMDFTKPGRSWANSALGSRLTCVAVCDVVKHPDVKLPGRIADDPESTGLGNHVKVPDKYVVVPNNDHLRVKYVFVFAERQSHRSAAAGWISRNKFLVMVLLYAFILVAVAVVRSSWWKRWLRSR